MKYITGCLLFFLSNYALADNQACNQFFYKLKKPIYIENTQTENLCNSQFFTLYSNISKTPLYSAEFLTKDKILSAKNFVRLNKFHTDNRINSKYQAKLKDYQNSGFDRGHLVPNSDMPNKKSQYESFSLSNIAPQNPNLNRIVWKNLEESIRSKIVKTNNNAYIITGVIFQNKTILKLNNSILVPDYFYKIVTYENGNQEIYIAKNDINAEIQNTTIENIQKLTKIKF